jgi:thymidylate synthase (FAD)
MKLIRPSVEIKVQEAGKEGMLRHIEWAGRHCYKSHDKITPDSAVKFVGNLVKSGHGSVLEHGTIYLAIPDFSAAEKYLANPYSKVNVVNNESDGEFWCAVTTNYRVIVENDWDMDLMYECEPTPHHEKRITAKFVCDRGVSHKKFVA